MNVMVCVDDKMGMMFHNRRQSKDRIVREDMLALVLENLWVSPYTAKQFEETEQERLLVAEDFLEQAKEGEYCFVEDADLCAYEERIERIVLYRWNRIYPADTYFTISLSDFVLEGQTHLTGNSHPDIVREVYTKKIEVRKDEVTDEE